MPDNFDELPGATVKAVARLQQAGKPTALHTAMLNWLHKLLQTKYVALLEAEVARLRAENRALTNSLLGTAGFPPVEYPDPVKPQPIPRLRKRSWHQIQAWKEAEAAPSDTTRKQQ